MVKEEPSVPECASTGADNEVHSSKVEKDAGPLPKAGEDRCDVLWYDANGSKLCAWSESDGTRFTVVTPQGLFYYYYSVAAKNGIKRYQCRFCRRTFFTL